MRQAEERLVLPRDVVAAASRRPSRLAWTLANRGLSLSFEGYRGKWRVCNLCCPCTTQQRQRAWCRSWASQQAPSSRDSGLLTMPDKTPSSSWWDVSHVWSRHRILSKQASQNYVKA